MAFTKSVATKTYVKTKCCRKVSVDMATNVVYSGQTVNNLFTLTLESLAIVSPKFTLNVLYVPTKPTVAYRQYYTTYTDLEAESLDNTSTLFSDKLGGVSESDIVFPSSLEPVRNSYTFGLYPASRIGRYMVNVEIGEPDRYLVYPYTWNDTANQYVLPDNFNATNIAGYYTKEDFNVTNDPCWNHTVADSSNCFWYHPPDYSSDYEVEFTRGTTFVVVQSSATVKAPKVTRAFFSDDGSYIILEFDSPTNRGGLFSLFSCEMVFDFPGASSGM